MKTLKKVKSELVTARKEAMKELSKREAKQMEKLLKKLYNCQLYLETNPTQEFVEKQLNESKERVKIINDGYWTWLKNSPADANSAKNPKSKYNTMMGLKTVKEQIGTLEYLLS